MRFEDLGGLDLVYDPTPTSEALFVLRPDCDQCGSHRLDRFPFEEWTIAGAVVRAQARTTCRDCRFRLLTQQSELLPLDLS